MNKSLLVGVSLVVGSLVMSSAQAPQKGSGAPSGAHYNLNIIGMEQAKTAPMTGSDRHTIFVALGAKDGAVTSKIYLVRGATFEVCDGNAADAAKDCAGETIQQNGAVFQLPCNTKLPTSTELVPCTDAGANASYGVYVRALGKPGGSAKITTCATDKTTSEEVCSTEHVVTVRGKGGQKFQDVTNELTSIMANIDDDPQLERVSLFSDPFTAYFWSMANQGQRLTQLRFYLQ